MPLPPLPQYISYVFLITVVSTLGFLYFGIKNTQKKGSKTALISTVCIIIWLLITAFLSKSGFILNFETLPPRFLLIIVPPTLVVIISLSLTKSRLFLIQIPIATLTYLHIIRVPVEMVLWWLALNRAIPMLLTFEGINYDILSGITAPFIAITISYFKDKSHSIAIIWNLAALGLLIHIVVCAILSAPFPFQKFAFEQPNLAVFYFPYVWLPGFVVPAVLFAHLISLVKLFSKRI